MSDKKDKDSYAKNTLQFSVPHTPHNPRPPSPPQGQPPQGYEPRHQVNEYRPDAQHIPHGQRPPMPNGQNADFHDPNMRRPPVQGAPRQRQQGVGPAQPQRPRQGVPVQPQRPQRRPQQRANSQRRQPAVQPLVPKKKHGRIIKRVIITVVIILAVLFMIYSVLALLLIGKLEKDETGSRTAPSHSLYESSSVRNILLIGTDSRGEDRGRSDSMILMSINRSTNKINLVSLMRDTYVEIPGHGSDKLNAAYSYGGPELLMDTIQENFYVRVDDYISINFTSFAGAVDAVGGVDVEVNDDEAAAINALLDSPEGVSIFGQPDEDDYLDGAGKYHLSGKQALCYSRLRKVGNADFERTERQRKVLTGIMENLDPSSIFSVLSGAVPDVHTNMSTFDMYILSLRVPFLLGFYDVKQLRIPAEDTFWDSTVDGQSVLEIDRDANLDIIKDKLYDD